jgi:SpoVK/Ycf46/Vps4 family AAA+-type ATPase
MSYFVRSGNRYTVASKNSFVYETAVPVGTYVVKYDANNKQYYLEIIEDFSISHKLYGDTIKNADRVINTFKQRPASTGVMLSGEKGSGKTLLAKAISIISRDSNIPTFIVNEPHCGDSFNTFLQTIDQECVVIFDEFEKVYSDKKDQEAILTLLDGVYPSKKLFILTVNDKYKVDINMKNRPGRIYYMLDFQGLDLGFIKEYCEDNLIHKDKTDSICKFSQAFDSFNFDMLKAMVEEINRYNESVNDVMRFLNTKPEFNSGSEYEVNITLAKTQARIKEIEEDEDSLDPDEVLASELSYINSVNINPLSLGKNGLEIVVTFKEKKYSHFYWYSIFHDHDLIDVNIKQSSFKFKNSDGDVMTLTKAKKTKFEFAF